MTFRLTEAQYKEHQQRVAPTIKCAICGKQTKRNSVVQKYCEECSAKRDIDRKRLWERNHPRQVSPETRKQKRSEMVERGKAISVAVAKPITGFNQPNLCWLSRVCIPFSYAASKNHIYTLRARGHVALRQEGKELRALLASKISASIKNQAIRNNKLWIDIFVQKSDHKGDAVNVIDLVCDAIKDAVPLDDRWYCIRGLDWQIVKENPRIYVGIGQEAVDNVHVCSSCGRLLPLEMFWRNKHAKSGVTRNCMDCARKTNR